MQDWQLDAFRRVNHMPERETEQPRDGLGGLPGRHERGSAETQLLAGQADAAVAGSLDVLVPIRLAPEVQAYDHHVPGTESAHRSVADHAGLAASVFQVGECSVAG
jgi:hypothetical protein